MSWSNVSYVQHSLIILVLMNFLCYERLQLSDFGKVHGLSSVTIRDLDCASGVQLIHRRRLKGI
jgi:hypothetical protein